MKFKSIALLGILASMAFSSAAFGAENEKKISVYFNSLKETVLNNTPFYIEGTSYLPIREIVEKIGAKVSYTAPFAVIEFNDDRIYKISENELWVYFGRNWYTIDMDKYAVNRNGVMYAPWEFFKKIAYVSEDETINLKVYLITWDSRYNNTVLDNYDFEIEVLKNIPKMENSVVSTSGIKSVLVLTSNGLEGESQKELLNALNITDIGAYNENYKNQMALNENSPFVSAKYNEANSVWINNGTEIKEEFSDTAKNYYNAYVDNVENKDLDKINEWIEENTNQGKEITNSDFEIMLLNIAEFNGTWLVPFDERNTKMKVFYSADGDEDKVRFMSFGAPVYDRNKFLYYEEEGLKAVTLKYGNNKEPYEFYTPFEMTFVLTEKEITSDTLKNIFNGSQKEEVYIEIPKLRIENTINMVEFLKKMGVQEMFEPYLADLSNMVEGDGYYISDVTQDAFLFVDEKGTSAAAVSEVDALRSIADNKKEFIANKPFYYFIRNKETGDILFEGYVANGENLY